MKEFEKWNQENYPLPAQIERGPIGRDCLQQRRNAWKAALEWIWKIYQVSPDIKKFINEFEIKMREELGINE